MAFIGWQGTGVCVIFHMMIIHYRPSVCGDTSSIVIPFTVPVNTFITKLSTSHAEFNTDEKLAKSLFHISEDGKLTTKKELFPHVGRSFSLILSNDFHEYPFIDILYLNIGPSWELKAFSSQTFYGMIQENLPPDSEVKWKENIHLNFNAVKYILEPSNEKFIVNITTDSTAISQVKIVTTSELDRESASEHIYILKAWLNDTVYTSTILKIKVLDINDCIPKFSQKIYKSTIFDDSIYAPSTNVLKVSAFDQDVEDQIIYSLSGTTAFAIHPNSGYLTAKAVRPGNYNFKVYATDTSGKQSNALVSIRILPSTLKFRPFHQISKRQAKFMTVEKTYVVLENQTAGTVVFSVASKPAAPPGTEFYSILYDSIQAFQVDTRGNVYLKSGHILDYENPQHRNVTVRFNITSSLSQEYQIWTVHLNVTDVNDEKPRFVNQPHPFLATVPVNPRIGELVYELLATDPDTNSDIQYNLVSGGEGKFTIEHIDRGIGRLGRIVTTVNGNGQFIPGQEYELVVSAQDLGSPIIQKSNFEVVRVLVGSRPPQFYSFYKPYVAFITENNQPGYKLQSEGTTLIVQAKAFQSKSDKGAVEYQLTDNYGYISSVFSINSEGEIEALQSLDYETSPHTYTLKLIGTEKSTGLSNATQLIVHLEDDNDNAPVFELSTYTNVTSEGTPVNSVLFSVTATDKDSGSNAELTYTVSDDSFVIETRNVNGKYIGDIKVAKRLDYDSRADRQYKFDVRATDHGNKSFSGLASVVLYVTNINDEAPVFSEEKDNIVAKIREDQKAGSYVTTVQAVDPDGDNIEYYFSPKHQISKNSLFRIEPHSGIITLTNTIPPSIPSYILNVTAYDDGSCCGGYPRLSSSSFVIIKIMDINNNNPTFPSCNYAPSVLENQPPGTRVVDVLATDPDRGDNGKITYSVVTPNNQEKNFEVNSENGTVVTKRMFDRESEAGVRGYSVTIKAEDHGESQQLNTLCTFWVRILDINDNPPMFDTESYMQIVVRSTSVNKRIMGVLAVDKDKEVNAEVQYSLVDNPGDYFRVDTDTGGLYLQKPLTSVPLYQEKIILRIMAKDKGIPPLSSNATITITLTTGNQNPPTWNDNYEGQTYTVNETSQIGFPIATFSATSHVDPPLDGVSFALVDSNGNSQQTVENFRVDSQDKTMKLKVANPLDVSVKSLYTLRLRVTNQGLTPLSDEIRITVKVLDMNNKQPQFEGLDPTLSNSYRGSVPENEEPGQSVITVKAVDPDLQAPNNVVSYSLVPDRYDAFKKFQIDPLSGLISTNYTFDRETMKVYYITVMAQDGRASDIPYHEPRGTPNSATTQVMVTIADKNDNTPYFEKLLYEKDVHEQPADSSKSILTVRAMDIDDADTLTYTITSGNTGNVFGIKSKTGDIYVAKDLDFETPPNLYKLNVTVSDGYHSNYTEVKVRVKDINDNAPEFSQSEYIVTSVVEEQQPPTEGLFLIKVSATDKDTSRQTNFRYSLNTEYQDTFQIHPTTGVITLHKSLDRDLPYGHAEYQFNVLVVDEPNTEGALVGYAYVKVKPQDINDKVPEFTRDLTGFVPENSEKGKIVMTVRAIDYDLGENGTVYYTLGNNRPADPKTGDSLFVIDSITGLVRSNTNTLDREKVDQYILPVIATDRGKVPLSSTASLTIQITDKNDERPRFNKKIYRATLPESQTSGLIITVAATDDDIGNNSKITYSLKSDLNFFSISSLPSNKGALNVYKPVDYEDPKQRFFNLTIRARDNNPLHYDEAYIEITVTDANDEAPRFTEPVKTDHFPENIPEKFLLYTFTATDNDSYPNNEFFFQIREHSDRFYVEQEGNLAHVKIQAGLDGQTLDRETKDQYNIQVLAIDKGSPPKTGSATLRIKVTDINDNPPTFAENYRPIVMEETDPIVTVGTFSAMDPDTLNYGPPFVFELPPCEENPTCHNGDQNFSLIYDPNGAKGNGTCTVFANKRFLREQKKFYHLPIIMKDMGGRGKHMSGTSTLTIEIGDKNNNQHVDGFKEIFVYNYRGMFGDVEIGRANANDPDDWDYVDKHYTMISRNGMEKFFNVSKINGTITMKRGVPAGIFEFKVEVHDFKVFTKINATATIKVVIKEISEEAVYKSGSVRLAGITAEEFVEIPNDMSGQSHYDKFRKLLAEKLRVAISYVEIFSVMKNGPYVDVRYAAHGSPWYPANKLDGIIATNKDQFAAAAGGQIVMVNIDECQKEICESGGCSNVLVVDERKPSVVNTKTQSFVGLGTKVVAECQCKARDFSRPLKCTPDFCFNGGTCVEDNWGDVKCECLPMFDGFRCQQTTHSFSGGYTLYPPLAQCEESITSIEFATLKESGLIFYNGPVDKMRKGDPQDFIALSLIQGYLELIVNHGTGAVSLRVMGKDRGGITRMPVLNDGAWHHLNIIRKGREVTLTVDHCRNAQFDTHSESREDRRPCEVTGSTSGQNKYLNVNHMLQMGGRYTTPDFPQGITQERFEGCIRNLYHNGELYDLYTSLNHPGENHGNGCPAEESACSSLSGKRCGDHGTCQMITLGDSEVECVCKPGYRPSKSNSPKCTRETTIRNYTEKAYMTWSLKDNFFNMLRKDKLDIHIKFRTRDLDGGVLLHLPSNSHEYISVQIINGHVAVIYNLKDYDNSFSENIISLSEAPAANGQWHSLSVKRIGRWFQLKMDSGEGRYYNETWGSIQDSQFFDLKRDHIVSGSMVKFYPIADFHSKDLRETCVTDIRINNKWFPMMIEENSQSDAAEVELISGVNMGCVRDDCAQARCHTLGQTIKQVCVPLWGTHDCRCPPGSEPGVGSTCLAMDHCQGINPCKAGGTCINLPFPGTFRCLCPKGWIGPTCNQQASAVEEVVSAGGIKMEVLVIIIVSLIAVTLIAFLVFLLWRSLSKRDKRKSILYDDQYDDIRENVVNHDEEGAGEEDQTCYDITRLRKPDSSFDRGYYYSTLSAKYRKGVPLDSPEVAAFISDRVQDVNEDPAGPPHDNVMVFSYEGGSSTAGSLSSLNTNSSDNDQDYDYLNDWGPKFSSLAVMYKGDEVE
ncbi:neural-cadherin-like [Saccostrea echinata]|uniref:neural-cadherin-like n=1 Tax=Saccostrea echinata TaxID=191078 RepID=UPI002A7F4376|nr:neural-cadherin-like [Saccostrea echinata]